MLKKPLSGAFFLTWHGLWYYSDRVKAKPASYY
jgi:hypothetical protein